MEKKKCPFHVTRVIKPFNPNCYVVCDSREDFTTTKFTSPELLTAYYKDHCCGEYTACATYKELTREDI